MKPDKDGIREKTVLLHIGTPKTGSTSIQRCLAGAHADRSLAPLCYPLWRDDLFHHNRLTMLYRPHQELYGWVRQEFPSDDTDFRRERRKYRRFFFGELGSARGAVISAEDLCGLALPHVAQLRADLESVGYRRFHVVLYVRDPADFYLSRTQQVLNYPTGEPNSLLSREKFGAELTATTPQFLIEPNSFVYDFRRAAETWEHVFPGCLIVRAFPSGPHDDVVADFAELLEKVMGVSMSRQRLRENSTLSAEAMQIVQDYRDAFWPDSHLRTADVQRLVNFLASSVEDVPQTKPVLKEALAQQIRANHSEDAEWLLSRYGVDLGIQNLTSAAATPGARRYRVDEIVQSVDPKIVHELLLRLVRSELGRPTSTRSLPMRAAASVYQTIPLERRPQRLVSGLRSLRRRLRLRRRRFQRLRQGPR